MTQRIRVGTQGWSYDVWAGRFYPEGTRGADRLTVYAGAFDVVEVDSTFYGLPPVERFVSWRERTPDHFLFALKMPGEVTHEAALHDVRLALRFCDDARSLGPKLGPILIQLPPRHGPAAFDVTAEFLRRLPEDLRFAIEFRDRAWLVPGTMAMLREVGVTLAVSVGAWLDDPAARAVASELMRDAEGERPGSLHGPGPTESLEGPGPTDPLGSLGATGSLLYLRWLEPSSRGRSPARLVEERNQEIRAWAELLKRYDRAQVLAFFNNDYQGHSPASARYLQSCLGQEPVPPAELSPQKELFG